MPNKSLAWHFVGKSLRDGRKIPKDGEVLEHTGPLLICQEGLHASFKLLDALQYAPGTTLCRVEVEGWESQGESDKVVARKRTILWRIDAEDVLRTFARKCALDVAHLWDCPPVVRKYLETGDEKLRGAALDAAGGAARAAAWGAAWGAAGAVAGGAAWGVAWDAAWEAARDKQEKLLTSFVEQERISHHG